MPDDTPVNTKVYFATNRAGPQQATSPWYGFDPAPQTPQGLTFAEALVTGTTIADQSSGVIRDITNSSSATFSGATRNALVVSKRDLLVFIHGFANAFED